MPRRPLSVMVRHTMLDIVTHYCHKGVIQCFTASQSDANSGKMLLSDCATLPYYRSFTVTWGMLHIYIVYCLYSLYIALQQKQQILLVCVKNCCPEEKHLRMRMAVAYNSSASAVTQTFNGHCEASQSHHGAASIGALWCHWGGTSMAIHRSGKTVTQCVTAMIKRQSEKRHHASPSTTSSWKGT